MVDISHKYRTPTYYISKKLFNNDKMKRHILFVSIAILAILATIIVFAGAQIAKAATITVDDSGGKDYTGIQDAINASSPGDTIFVYNGEYSEQLTINKTISLVGESNQNTIIQRNEYGIGIYVTANYVNISNIRIDGSSNGIWLDMSSNNTIKSNTITSSSDYGFCGIFIGYSSNNTITSNTITSNSGYGIYISYLSQNNAILYNTLFLGGVVSEWSLNTTTFRNNTLDGLPVYFASNIDSTANPTIVEGAGQVLLYNVSGFVVQNTRFDRAPLIMEKCYQNIIHSNIINNSDGIMLYTSSNNTILSNTITNSSRYHGIVLFLSDNNTIVSNTILNNRGGSVIWIHSSTNNTISSNTLTNESIAFDVASNNTISNNTITNGSLILTQSSNNTILVNVIITNGEYDGISLYDSPNNTVSANIIMNNNRYGISISDSPNNTIISNTLTNNSYGIYFHESPNNAIASNTLLQGGIVADGDSLCTTTFQNNTLDGRQIYFIKDVNSTGNPTIVGGAGQVLLYNASGIIIQNNNFNRAPVILIGCTENTIISNNITNGSWYGLYLTSSSNNSIVNNTITNTSHGIHIEYSSKGNTISSNIVTSNRGIGVYLYGSSNNTISSNTIRGSGGDGISDRWSWNNTVSFNTIANNGGHGICVWEGSGGLISSNKITNNGGDGIYIRNPSKDNFLTSNTIADNGNNGIDIYSSTNTIIMSNAIYNNTYGITVIRTFKSIDPSFVYLNNSFSFGGFTNKIASVALFKRAIFHFNTVDDGRFKATIYLYGPKGEELINQTMDEYGGDVKLPLYVLLSDGTNVSYTSYKIKIFVRSGDYEDQEITIQDNGDIPQYIYITLHKKLQPWFLIFGQPFDSILLGLFVIFVACAIDSLLIERAVVKNIGAKTRALFNKARENGKLLFVIKTPLWFTGFLIVGVALFAVILLIPQVILPILYITLFFQTTAIFGLMLSTYYLYLFITKQAEINVYENGVKMPFLFLFYKPRGAIFLPFAEIERFYEAKVGLLHCVGIKIKGQEYCFAPTYGKTGCAEKLNKVLSDWNKNQVERVQSTINQN